MKNYFYKINEKYIQEFSRRVVDRFMSFNLRSNSSFLKSIFMELNSLFQKIGGRITSKYDIPRGDDFPDSDQHNRMINNIWSDLDKLFRAQRLIEDDVNNLLNFNSIQRIKTFENMSNIQQKVYSLFIRNQQGLSGERTEEVLFNSTQIISSESEEVKIDEDRGVLTLNYQSRILKPVDTINTLVFFHGDKPKGPLYPNAQAGTDTNNLHVGSHWKRFSRDPHFIDTTDSNMVRSYKAMIIDDPNLNTGVGWCEFEAVRTILDPQRNTRDSLLAERKDLLASTRRLRITTSFGRFIRNVVRLAKIESQLISLKKTDLHELKEEIGQILNKDSNLIYLDYENSLQHEYAKYGSSSLENPDVKKIEFRMVIPFLNSPITNEIAVSLRSNEESGDEDGGIIPIIDWNKSKVWSRGYAYPLVPPATLSDTVINDGEYVCKIVNHVIPERLELVLYYQGDQWQKLPFYMAHYVYSMTKNYHLPALGQTISLTLGKNYDIFVDAEPRLDNESNRAIKVLLNHGKL